MLRTNIIGGIFVVLVVFAIVAFSISLRISLEWATYFKILGIVAVIAIAVSIITHIIPSKN